MVKVGEQGVFLSDVDAKRLTPYMLQQLKKTLILDFSALQSHSSFLTTGSIIINEIPIGILNGVNATFTSLYPFIPETVEVFINGLKQKITNDYITSGNSTIITNVSLSSTELILINYKKL